MAAYVFAGVLVGILLPLVIVYVLIVDVARSNTNELVRDKAAIIIAVVEDHVTGLLDPIPDQVVEVAGLLQARGLTIENTDEIEDLFETVAQYVAQPQYEEDGDNRNESGNRNMDRLSKSTGAVDG